MGCDAGMGIGAAQADGKNMLLASIEERFPAAIVACKDAGNSVNNFLLRGFGLIVLFAIRDNSMGQDAWNSLLSSRASKVMQARAKTVFIVVGINGVALSSWFSSKKFDGISLVVPCLFGADQWFWNASLNNDPHGLDRVLAVVEADQLLELTHIKATKPLFS